MTPLITPLRPWLEGSVPSTGAEQPADASAGTREDDLETLPPPWRALTEVRLSVTWAPPAVWRPVQPPVVPTRDFRKGYPWVWDLEVPMRRLTRPLPLRPGLKRPGPPPPGPNLEDSALPAELERPPALQTLRTAAGHSSSTPELVTPDAGTSEPVGPDCEWSERVATAPAAPAPPSPRGPKGSRMKGWSRRADWLAEDPWRTA